MELLDKLRLKRDCEGNSVASTEIATTINDDASTMAGFLDRTSKQCMRAGESSSLSSSTRSTNLPKKLSVLFVDDDRTLRRLAMRGLKNLIPDCHVRETCSGESALILCETDSFDIIFMDMYMTSTTDNSMTGTEAVIALRAKGVTSLICGLSANQEGGSFLRAGADHFILKPFPCKESELRPELVGLLAKRRRNDSTVQSNESEDIIIV